VAAAVRGEVGTVSPVSERGVVGLATFHDDPASQVYVGNKQRAPEVGIRSPHRLRLRRAAALAPCGSSAGGRRTRSSQLPPAASTAPVIEPLAEKDVDGLHPLNQGRLLAGEPGLRPCTPLGVMRLLDETGVTLKGARAAVVGRSVLVGKPVALLLLERHATVTICHSRTADLGGEVGRADVVVAATGQAGLVRGTWIRPGAVVIDVGINRGADGKLCGDVEFAPALERAARITPVPGGVGPMTVAMLLANSVSAAEHALGMRAA
jgi:methylenetetrahydrofolate dehydrogenase (NADP+)/methenyltetrahydrofolate cyclohydrolase